VFGEIIGSPKFSNDMSNNSRENVEFISGLFTEDKAEYTENSTAKEKKFFYQEIQQPPAEKEEQIESGSALYSLLFESDSEDSDTYDEKELKPKERKNSRRPSQLLLEILRDSSYPERDDGLLTPISACSQSSGVYSRVRKR
jgi:hypothetical protein